MVKISNRVWTVWRERSAQSSKAYVELVLKPARGSKPADIEAEVRQVLSDVVSAHYRQQDALPPDQDEVGAGVWATAAVPEGILITAGQKVEAFEELLTSIKGDLDRRGVSGSIGLYEPSPLDLPEWWLYRGHRRHVSGTIWLDSETQELDADRFELLAKDAIGWCLDHPPDIALFTSCLDLPDLAVRLDDDPWEALARLPRGWWKGLTSLSATGYRQVFLHTFPKYHAVTVLAGSAADNYEWVEPARQSIREFLIDHHATTYYSMINTQYGTGDGGSGSVSNGHNVDRNFPRNMRPFVDRRVADFFSTQVLGPDFARPAPRPDWTQTELRERRLLLEHKQPARWLGPEDPFPTSHRWPVPEFPAPEIIAATRTHFAELCIPKPENTLSWVLLAKAERLMGSAPGSGPWEMREFTIILADGRTEDRVLIESEGDVHRDRRVARPLDVDAAQVVDVVYTPLQPSQAH